MGNTELATALTNNADLINQLTSAANNPAIQIVAVPNNVKLESLDAFAEKKRFSKERFVTTDLGSFLTYVEYRAADFGDNIGAVDVTNNNRVVASVWFGRDKGYGQGRNKAEFGAELEAEAEAVLKYNNCLFNQQNFVLEMETLPFVTFFDADGNDMPFDQALARLSSLTTEQAKVSKSVVGDFGYELSNSERAMVQDLHSLPVGFKLDTKFFRGTKDTVTLVAKISVLVKDDSVSFSLRIPELSVVQQAKVQEVVREINALSIPTFFGHINL